MEVDYSCYSRLKLVPDHDLLGSVYAHGSAVDGKALMHIDDVVLVWRLMSMSHAREPAAHTA